jgi:hypothetical protein
MLHFFTSCKDTTNGICDKLAALKYFAFGGSLKEFF